MRNEIKIETMTRHLSVLVCVSVCAFVKFHLLVRKLSIQSIVMSEVLNLRFFKTLLKCENLP